LLKRERRRRLWLPFLFVASAAVVAAGINCCAALLLPSPAIAHIKLIAAPAALIYAFARSGGAALRCAFASPSFRQAVNMWFAHH